MEGLEESDINIDQVCEKCGWPMCLNCKNDKNISNVQHDECEITVARGTKFNLHNYSNPHPTYQCLTGKLYIYYINIYILHTYYIFLPYIFLPINA